MAEQYEELSIARTNQDHCCNQSFQGGIPVNQVPHFLFRIMGMIYGKKRTTWFR